MTEPLNYSKEPWKLKLPDYDTSFVPSVTIGKFIINIQDAEDGSSNVDNAKLITLAPKLYEALKMIEDYAQQEINDYAADIQEGGNPSLEGMDKWSEVLSVLYKAENL